MRAEGWLAEERRVHSIIGAFYESYNALGSGFLESVYAAALARELRDRGHSVHREVRVQVMYKGEPLALQRLDMVVDGRVVLEIKATTNLQNQPGRQLFNYLRATGLQVGLLLHYGQKPRFFRVFCSPNRGDQGEEAVDSEQQ